MRHMRRSPDLDCRFAPFEELVTNLLMGSRQKQRSPTVRRRRTDRIPSDGTLIPEPLKVTPRHSLVPKTTPKQMSALPGKSLAVSPNIRERQQQLLDRTGGDSIEQNNHPQRCESKPSIRRATDSIVLPKHVRDPVDPESGKKSFRAGTYSDTSSVEIASSPAPADITLRALLKIILQRVAAVQEAQQSVIARVAIIESQLKVLIETMDETVVARKQEENSKYDNAATRPGDQQRARKVQLPLPRVQAVASDDLTEIRPWRGPATIADTLHNETDLGNGVSQV